MNRTKNKILFAAFVLLFILSFAGCDENGGITIPSGVSELTVSVKPDDNIQDNPASIIISEAKALVANVEFEKLSNGKDELHQRGPFVIIFSLDGTMREMGTQFIIRDNYTKIKFQIHKPEDNEIPADPEFRTGAAGNQRFSFIIKGTYNGNSFAYKSKQSLGVVINFSKVENINLKKSNITVLFNRLKWFRNGSTEVNPNDPQYESLIDENIKNSFLRAFKDDDKNGLPDDN